MAGNTLIQIKRSLTTNIPSSLANGEFAWTSNGDVLYVGANSVIVAMGGKRTPGTLTANQALVVNATGMIDTLKVGNSTVNAVINQANLVLANSTASISFSIPSAAQITSGSVFLGANGLWQSVSAGASDIDSLTDVTISSVANNNLLVYNTGTNQWVNKAGGNGLTFTAQVPSILAGNGITVDAGGVNVRAGTDGGLTVNATGTWVFANSGLLANATGLHVGTGNGTAVDADSIRVLAGTDGGLVSNATGVFVIANNGLVTNSIGLHVGTGNGMAIDADSIRVLGSNGILANATGTWVVAGTGVVVNSTGVSIGQNVATSAYVTFANVVTTDMTVSGNLSVTGTLVTVDAVNLVVNDSIISLGRNNGADILDIGFYGQYNDGTERFTGLIWDTTDDTWFLFANTVTEPTTTMDTVAVGFVKSTLRAWLNTGALVSNLTHTNITANSTVTVALVANSLTLTTALVGTSGGTGLASIANQSILVANSTNGYAALAIGTGGFVLQSNITGGVEWSSIDGGTFLTHEKYINSPYKGSKIMKGRIRTWKDMDLFTSGGTGSIVDIT